MLRFFLPDEDGKPYFRVAARKGRFSHLPALFASGALGMGVVNKCWSSLWESEARSAFCLLLNARLGARKRARPRTPLRHMTRPRASAHREPGGGARPLLHERSGARTRSGSRATPRLLWVGGRGGGLTERGVSAPRALAGLSLPQRGAATAAGLLLQVAVFQALARGRHGP